MRIITHGVVIISDEKISVEGWNVQREPSDPPQAKTEELLLAVVVEWALAKLQTEVNSESVAALLKEAKRLKTEALMSEIKGN